MTNTQKLIDDCNELAALLEKNGNDWAPWFKESATLMQTDMTKGCKYVLRSLGGMGSYAECGLLRSPKEEIRRQALDKSIFSAAEGFLGMKSWESNAKYSKEYSKDKK